MYCLGKIVVVFVYLHENYIVYKHHNCHCTPRHGIQYVYIPSFMPVAHSLFKLHLLTLNKKFRNLLLKIELQCRVLLFKFFSHTYIMTLQISLCCQNQIRMQTEIENCNFECMDMMAQDHYCAYDNDTQMCCRSTKAIDHAHTSVG